MQKEQKQKFQQPIEKPIIIEMSWTLSGKSLPHGPPSLSSRIIFYLKLTWWNMLILTTSSDTFVFSLSVESCPKTSAQIPRPFILESRKCFEGWVHEVIEVGVNILIFDLGWKQPEFPHMITKFCQALRL